MLSQTLMAPAAWSPLAVSSPAVAAEGLFSWASSLDTRAWGLVFVAYLLGSVPFGLWVTRLVKGVDLRQVGSGNIGATNAMRALGKPLGIFVFLLDASKGALVILFLVPLVTEEPNTALLLSVLCGAAAVIGHCWPLYLKFKGGKGVATGCGALAAIDPMLFLLGGVVWLVTLASLRMVGLASMAMGVSFPIWAYFRLEEDPPCVVVGAALLALLVLIRHRSNIARMLAGKEPRIGAKSVPKETAS